MRVIADSLPKSGTHLLVRFLNLLGLREHKLHLSGSLVRLTERNPLRRLYKKRRLWRERMPGTGFKVDLDDPENMIRGDWLKKKLQAVPDNCFIQAHLPYTQQLKSLFLSMNYKILFIIRNPRDVAISFCNHMVRDPDYNPYHDYFKKTLSSTEERINAVLEGLVLPGGNVLAGLSKRLEHSVGWWQTENVCSVRYEDLIGPKGGGSEIKQIQQVQKLCMYLGIKYEQVRYKQLASNLFFPKARTFYQGTIGSHKKPFTPELEELFAEQCAVYLDRLSYGNKAIQ
jgi:hypothetical protein